MAHSEQMLDSDLKAKIIETYKYEYVNKSENDPPGIRGMVDGVSRKISK